MDGKKLGIVILFGAMILAGLLLFVLSTGEASPAEYAHQKCQSLVASTMPHSQWELKSSEILSAFQIEYRYFDGCNTTTIKASGVGRLWFCTGGLTTLLACLP